MDRSSGDSDRPESGGVHDFIRGFYGTLKGNAEYLRFVMLTGITKVSHVNIFSGLNNLTDLSLQPWCNAICGISESELQNYFAEDMETFGRVNNMPVEEVRAQFKRYYDGYRFARCGENIYNPNSVMLAFQNMEFNDYWFVSGTPTHLIRTLNNEDFNFDGLEGYVPQQGGRVRVLRYIAPGALPHTLPRRFQRCSR